MPAHVSEIQIDSIREKFDSKYERWPPHINLLYPFYDNIDLIPTSEDQIGSVIGDILQVTSRLSPFECNLNKIGTFDKNKIVYLEPSDESTKENMRNVFKKLKSLFNDKNMQSNWADSFNPHFTIAQPDKKKECERNWAQ